MAHLSRSLAAFLALVGATMLTACAGSSYMGISLRPGAADPGLQFLAERARGGDKQAQLELGIAFEEGRRVERDLDMAMELYHHAAADERNVTWLYVPPLGKHLPGRVIALERPSMKGGLAEAKRRLIQIDKIR